MKKDDNDFKFWKAYTKTVKPISKKDYLTHHVNDFQTLLSKDTIVQQKDLISYDSNKNTENPYHLYNQSVKNTFLADKNMKKKMKKGQFIYDAKIDLHGFTQDQAFDALKEFITYNYQRKIRHLLVVTGKGRYCYQKFESLGILIKKVPQWLKEPPLSCFISIIEQASSYDGAQGALYIILKK